MDYKYYLTNRAYMTQQITRKEAQDWLDCTTEKAVLSTWRDTIGVRVIQVMYGAVGSQSVFITIRTAQSENRKDPI